MNSRKSIFFVSPPPPTPSDGGGLGVVIKIVMTSPYSAMLKDRDYDVTPHIILILSLTLTQNARGVGERLRGVVWIWVIVGEECEVKMVGEVARG